MITTFISNLILSKSEINKYAFRFPSRVTWTLITFGSFDISGFRASINQVCAERKGGSQAH